MEVIEVCPKHGETVFSVLTNGVKICKKCAQENLNNVRHRYKEILVDYKGGKCSICGYDKCITALEFHHLDPKEKDFSISSSNIHNIEKMKKEVDKCILVCSNCHHEIHYNLEKEKAIQNKMDLEEKKKEFYKDLSRDRQHRIKDSFKYLDIESISEDITKGLNKTKLCEKYHISHKTLKKFMEEFSVVYDNKVNRARFQPTKEELEKLIEKHSFVYIGKLYGITDNAVRKWCKKFNLPYKKEDVAKYIKSRV